MLNRKNIAVDLGVRLHCVAPVDEKRRTIVQHHRRARRTGEAGEPGEPLFARGQVFILLAVGARHHEAV